MLQEKKSRYRHTTANTSGISHLTPAHQDPHLLHPSHYFLKSFLIAIKTALSEEGKMGFSMIVSI